MSGEADTGKARRTREDVKNSPDKPPRVEVASDQIPAEIKLLPRWCCWKWVWSGEKGKWDKPPFNPRTGRHASSTDPSTWAAFSEALAAYRAGRFDGIG